MKTANYIYNQYNERGMKSFEKRVSNVLKTHGITGESIALNAWMERGSGYGSYYKCCKIQVNGVDFILKVHTHDSQMWDDFEATKKEERQLFEAVLNEEIENLLELIEEENND